MTARQWWPWGHVQLPPVKKEQHIYQCGDGHIQHYRHGIGVVLRAAASRDRSCVGESLTAFPSLIARPTGLASLSLASLIAMDSLAPCSLGIRHRTYGATRITIHSCSTSYLRKHLVISAVH